MRSNLPSLLICSIDEIRSDLSAGLVTLSVASCDVFSPRRRADVLEVPYDIYVVTDITKQEVVTGPGVSATRHSRTVAEHAGDGRRRVRRRLGRRRRI